MGKDKRHRHQFIGFIRRISEHKTLIACASRIHSHCDIAGLLMNRGQNRAGRAIEAPRRVCIADFSDDFADNVRNFDVGFGGDFTGDERNTGR